MVDLVGQTLGQYRIIEQIGQGGMATVYKAYQPSLDRYVAIKVLPPYFAHESGFAERFTREAKAIARLNHPNILPIYDFGQEGNLSYIVMKYVEAGTLKDILGASLNLHAAADVIRQIAAALDHAHQRGILHRDVKPSNVLLDEGRWVLLTDFGLAKMVEGSVALTGSGVGVGTPAYMSPEQGQGQKVDARADIYSLGVVLYEMLTGRVPFEAETPMAIVIKHITEPLPLPRTLNPKLPEAIERIILKALAKGPTDRFASTLEMADALTAAVAEAAEDVSDTVAVPAKELRPKPAPAATQVVGPSKTVQVGPGEAPSPAPPPAKPAAAKATVAVPAAKAPAATRRGFPWKIVGAVVGVVLLAVVAIVVASRLGDEGEGKETPTVVAAATATTARPAPTRTPRPEASATSAPSRPASSLSDVQFETVYLKTDFEGDKAPKDLPPGWSIREDDGGNHVLAGAGPNPPFMFHEGFEWQDYEVELRVKLVEGEEGHVLVRWPASDAEGGVVLIFAADRWELVQEPDSRVVDRYRTNNAGVWRRLRVVVVGNRLAASLDGEPMFDAEIESPVGSVGLSTLGDSVILADDLRIAGPPLPPSKVAEMELYDDFDGGDLDETRWEWRPAAEGDFVAVSAEGVLVIEAQNPSDEPRYGQIVALHGDRPVVELQANLAVEHSQGEFTDLLLYFAAEGGRMAGIIGERGNVAAFEQEGGLRIFVEGEGIPAQYHLQLTLKPGGEMVVVVDGQAVGAIPAPPAAGSFAITYRVDPGGALAGWVDNVMVRYLDQTAAPGEPPPPGSSDCEDELGCVEIPPGEPIHLAYLLDQSGSAVPVGMDSLRGIEIAISDKGQVLGHAIELTGEDSACNPEIGHEAVSRIIADPSVVAIIGPTCSTVGWATMPVVSESGLVIVSPSNTRPLLTEPEAHGPGYLRTAPNDKVQGQVAAQFAWEALGVRRAATLFTEDPYTAALQESFAEAFKSLGGEMTVQAVVGPGEDEDEVRSVLNEVAQTRPEFIFYPLFFDQGGLVTRLARETAGLEETILMGADGMFAPEFLEVAGPAANGLYLSAPELKSGSAEYQEFVARYKTWYGEPPQTAYHAYAYDATTMVLTAIEEVAAQEPDGALRVGRQALRQALYATRNFEGLTGNLSCTPTGDCAEGRVSVYQVVFAEPARWEPGVNPVKVWP